MRSKRDYRPENTGNPFKNLAIAMVKNACDDWQTAYVYSVKNEVNAEENKKLIKMLLAAKKQLAIVSKQEQRRIECQKENNKYAAPVGDWECGEVADAARVIDERYKEVCALELAKHKRTVRLVNDCAVALSKAVAIDRAYAKAKAIMQECEVWLREVGTGMLDYDAETIIARIKAEADEQLKSGDCVNNPVMR